MGAVTNVENEYRPVLTGQKALPDRRFMSVEQAADELNVSENQIRALLHTGELRGIQIGGRGLWRIGTADLESFITSAYARTEERIANGALHDTQEGR
jgi:excisionase family DNA binding protein